MFFFVIDPGLISSVNIFGNATDTDLRSTVFISGATTGTEPGHPLQVQRADPAYGKR